MKLLLSLAMFAVLGLLVSGCDSSVDRDLVTAKIEATEKQVASIKDFITKNKPAVEAITVLAEQTKDPVLIQAAAKLGAAVAEAERILPTAETELETLKTTVANLQTDADGKVPWYMIAGAAVWPYVPRLLTFIPLAGPYLSGIAALFANFHWNTIATRKQKDEEAEIVAKAKGA